jgi:hypothetical protein
MADPVSQQDFYGRDKMHYMASQAMCEHDYECLHDSHLDPQDCMRHPIAFLAEMMGDIMYLHQALHQTDARELWKLSSRKLTVMVTSTTTIGSSSHVQKYQKALKLCPQYGQCNASKISRREGLQSTRPGSTFMVGSRNLARTTMKPVVE